jgi:hypothetical protein
VSGNVGNGSVTDENKVETGTKSVSKRENGADSAEINLMLGPVSRKWVKTRLVKGNKVETSTKSVPKRENGADSAEINLMLGAVSRKWVKTRLVKGNKVETSTKSVPKRENGADSAEINLIVGCSFNAVMRRITARRETRAMRCGF